MMDLLSGFNVCSSPCALCPCSPVSVPSLSCLHQSQAVGGAQSGASCEQRACVSSREQSIMMSGDITALIALLER